MSYESDSFILKKLPSQSLAVITCAIQTFHPNHRTPKHMSGSYSVHFVLSGKGTVLAKGKEYKLRAGMGFIMLPGINYTYWADDVDPWKYMYASFKGADSAALVLAAGLDEENFVFNYPLDDDMLANIHAMHAAGKKNEARGYDVTGYFLLIMSRLIKSVGQAASCPTKPEQYVKRAKQYIEDNFSYGITVADIAAYVGLDRTYLYKLFKKYDGTSPHRYLCDLRLSYAAKMLENHDITINEAAVSTGFCDLSHFYKAFSAKFGITPKQYRESCYGDDDIV